MADLYAKKALTTFGKTIPNWDPMRERRAISQAVVASQFLHDLSERVFLLRKETSTHQPEGEGLPLQKWIPQDPDPRTFSLWTFKPITPQGHPTWDENWINIVQHYFSLKWPQGGFASDPGISLLELLLDLCITFQIRAPSMQLQTNSGCLVSRCYHSNHRQSMSFSPEWPVNPFHRKPSLLQFTRIPVLTWLRFRGKTYGPRRTWVFPMLYRL